MTQLYAYGLEYPTFRGLIPRPRTREDLALRRDMVQVTGAGTRPAWVVMTVGVSICVAGLVTMQMFRSAPPWVIGLGLSLIVFELCVAVTGLLHWGAGRDYVPVSMLIELLHRPVHEGAYASLPFSYAQDVHPDSAHASLRVLWDTRHDALTGTVLPIIRAAYSKVHDPDPSQSLSNTAWSYREPHPLTGAVREHVQQILDHHPDAKATFDGLVDAYGEWYALAFRTSGDTLQRRSTPATAWLGAPAPSLPAAAEKTSR